MKIIKKIFLSFFIINFSLSFIFSMQDNKNLSIELVEAVKTGNLIRLKEIINLGVNINNKDQNGNTILFLASLYGQKEVVELLINIGANVNERDNNGRTPLMYAAYNGHTSVIELLLQSGADVYQTDNWGTRTAIYVAFFNGHREVLDLFEDWGFEHFINDSVVINRLSNLTLEKKFDLRVQDIFKRFLKWVGDNDVIYNNKTVLMRAAEIGNEEAVEILLKAGTNINLKNDLDQTALSLAKENNKLNIIVMLKKHVYSWFNEIIELFYNKTNLSFNICYLIFKELLRKIGTIRLKDSEGNNLLHHAFKSGNLEFVKIIYALDPGLIAQENKLGQTPVSFLYSSEYIEKFVKLNLLKDNHEYIEVISNKNWDRLKQFFEDNKFNFQEILLLIDYIYNKDLIGIENLLKLNIDINQKNIAGYTPLHYASMTGNVETVKLLLNYGPDVSIESEFAEKPLDIALKYGYIDIVNLLKSAQESNKKRKLN